MTECMGHEVEPQTEAHRLLQNASMARGEAGQMFSAITEMRAEMASAGKHAKSLLERAIHAQQEALVNKAMEAGRLEQQAMMAKGYVKRLRTVAS